ncbi:hypothetical protein ACMYR3_11030 [Ampullimonas aquatilis]|uniref:hypothetical protein n=1 Tax=Ampullimonas aquatilis TaxID=1341549 RepID=UPI003C741F88
MKNFYLFFKGGLATFLVVSLSLFACISVKPELLMGWVTLFLVSMVPTQMIISLLWRCEYPQFIAVLQQPVRGLMFILFTLIAGCIIGFGALKFIGGNISPPTPFVNMYLIFTVPIALWLIIPFQAWPLKLIFKNQGTLGIALMVSTYVLAYLLFQILFSFGFLSEAPFYRKMLDPDGLYMAWNPLALSIATVAIVLIFVLLDFWPITALSKVFPSITKQPLFGIANLLLTALTVFLMWFCFVVWGGMDVVTFQTEVCVSLIFGLFIVLIMFEGLPVMNLFQPFRGLIMTAIACVIAKGMLNLYQAVLLNNFLLASGRPTYSMEIWLASSMLAVTFPTMVMYANYLQFWPLSTSNLKIE